MQDLCSRYLVICLLSSISLATHAQVQLENNNAPIVKIIKPKANEPLQWNTLVPYTITVNDAEDGHSAYDEIADREVILITKYLKDSSRVNDYLARRNQDLVPLMTMTKSTCLNCHAAGTKLIGPSFDKIAKKYSEKARAKVYLAEKVIGGSNGIWGEEKMPPQPDLNKAEVDLIVDWILRQKDHPTSFYVGLEGAFRMTEEPVGSEREVLILTAAYKDHGLTGTPKSQKLGLHTITIRSRAVINNK